MTIAKKSIESYYLRTSPQKIKSEVSTYLMNQSKFLFSILNKQYELYVDKLTEDELKGKLKYIVNSTRYGKNGYFWINDTYANIIDHPFKPELNGKDLSEFKDENGKKIFTEFARIAKNDGEGFIDYVWSKPNFEKPQPKISFVKLFEQFNWVIGTGAYIDDVTLNFKNEAIKTISEMRYGKSGYFWINDTKPKMIMHPIRPSLDGKDISTIKDPNGVYLFNDMVEVCNTKGEGLVKYSWKKPSKDKPQPKLSYVTLFKPWNWIIGSGAYIDDIEEKINIMKDNTKKEVYKTLLQILFVTIFLILMIVIVVLKMSNEIIINPINNLNEGIQKLLSKNSYSVGMRVEKQSNDELGEVVDNFNKYLETIEYGLQEDAKLIDEAKIVINKVKLGNYSKSIKCHTDNNSLNEFKDEVNDMLKVTKEHFLSINNVLQRYANNDYTQILVIDTLEDNSEFNLLVNRINRLKDTITDILVKNENNGITLKESSNILLKSVDKLNINSKESENFLEETVFVLDQITENVINNTNNIIKMAENTNLLTSSSNEGKELATHTAESMDNINTQVLDISKAITIIDEIAFQTNILSLNAAVEASTAGEAGKGFAVVAQEVRRLANSSADASSEIKKLVENATKKAKSGKMISDKMIEGYIRLNTTINETIKLILDVELSSKKQKESIQQINDSINKLDKQTQENASIAAISHDVALETDELATIIVHSVDDKKFIGKNSSSFN